MPYDSASQLVTYVEIVEVVVPDRFLDLGGEDYSLSDSLYARAISWMQTQFGKREAKQMNRCRRCCYWRERRPNDKSIRNYAISSAT